MDRCLIFTPIFVKDLFEIEALSKRSKDTLYVHGFVENVVPRLREENHELF